MLRIPRATLALIWAWIFSIIAITTTIPCTTTTGFSIVFMAKRGKGNLKRVLEDNDAAPPKSSRSLNQGRGQEITGVTLPAEGRVKGWEFGDGVRLAAANVNGQFYALQGECPRCAFDLWKGDLVLNDAGFDYVDCLACPTCATTYALGTGKAGPPLKRKGLAALVGNLAKTATANESNRNAKAFAITRDETTGQVFCREK